MGMFLPVILKNKLAEMKDQSEVTAQYIEDVKKFNDLMEILNSSEIINNQILSIPLEDWLWLRSKIEDFEDMESEFCQEIERDAYERQVYYRIVSGLSQLPIEGVETYV